MANRAAAFGVALFVLTVLTRRLGLIAYSELILPFATAGIILVAGCVMAIMALVETWARGSYGSLRALRALAVALIVLVPYGIAIYRFADNPAVNDVATDALDPPGLIATDEMEVAALPGLATRRYDATIERVTVGVQAALAELGWRVEGSAAPRIEIVPEADASAIETLGVPSPRTRPLTDEQLRIIEAERARAAAASAERRRENDAVTMLRAQVSSPVLNLVSDIAIRLRDDGDSTTVDIRARSREGTHDFGENARRMRAFLTELDAAMVREGVR